MAAPGYSVDSDALLAHCRGSDTASLYFGQLAKVLETARVSDDCFGPIGEPLVGRYHESLQGCQEQATKAKTFMQGVSERATQTAQAYQEADDSVARAFAELSSGPANPANLFTIGGADADSDQKGWFEQNAGYGSSWASALSDIARASSPPDAAIAAVNARMEQLELVKSPGQAFLDNGLGFLIAMALTPIVEFVLEPAIGDPEQMRSTGEGWSEIADWVKQAGEHEAQRAAATSDVWRGDAGDAFRTQMTEFSQGAAAFAAEIGNLQQFLELAADLFDTFVEVCIDILQDLVIGLIIEWLAALAASWVSAGASVAAAGVATTGEVAYTGIRLGTLVNRLQGQLWALVSRLEKLLEWVRTNWLSKAVEVTQGLRKGNLLERQIAKKIDSNPIAKILTKADAETMESAADNLFTRHYRKKINKVGDSPSDVDGLDTGISSSTTSRADSGTSDAGRDTGTPQDPDKATFSLANNLADAGLRMAGLSGTTNLGSAALNAVGDNAPGLAMEQGVKYAYNELEDPSTAEERQAAMDRGFTYE